MIDPNALACFMKAWLSGSVTLLVLGSVVLAVARWQCVKIQKRLFVGVAA